MPSRVGPAFSVQLCKNEQNFWKKVQALIPHPLIVIISLDMHVHSTPKRESTYVPQWVTGSWKEGTGLKCGNANYGLSGAVGWRIEALRGNETIKRVMKARQRSERARHPRGLVVSRYNAFIFDRELWYISNGILTMLRVVEAAGRYSK